MTTRRWYGLSSQSHTAAHIMPHNMPHNRPHTTRLVAGRRAAWAGVARLGGSFPNESLIGACGVASSRPLWHVAGGDGAQSAQRASLPSTWTTRPDGDE